MIGVGVVGIALLGVGWAMLSVLRAAANFVRPVIEVKMLTSGAKEPTRALETDVGYDLTSIERVVLKPGSITNIRTGVAVACKKGHYFTIEGRSSLFKKGIFPARGILDATYTGETLVALVNHSELEYEIQAGDRIAQLVIHPVISGRFKPVEIFSAKFNVRGSKGFGSTGR